MSKEYQILVHTIAEDGMPPSDLVEANLTGRVCFIFDGSIYTGWPFHKDGEIVWEDSETVRIFEEVKKWIELPVPGWNL